MLPLIKRCYFKYCSTNECFPKRRVPHWLITGHYRSYLFSWLGSFRGILVIRKYIPRAKHSPPYVPESSQFLNVRDFWSSVRFPRFVNDEEKNKSFEFKWFHYILDVIDACLDSMGKNKKKQSGKIAWNMKKRNSTRLCLIMQVRHACVCVRVCVLTRMHDVMQGGECTWTTSVYSNYGNYRPTAA